MAQDTSDLTITIPIPTHIPLVRGRAAQTKFDSVYHIRWGKEDAEVINRAADILGVNATAFIRQCALYAAREVIQRNDGIRPHISIG